MTNRPAWQPDCWRSYELPAGRAWESFRWLVEDIFAGSVVDEAVTDDVAARDRMTAGALEQAYDVRVTDRRTDEVVVHRWKPGGESCSS